jgi:DNA-binding PadR family transcriptional regulator
MKKLSWDFRFSFPRIFFVNKKEENFNMDALNKLKEQGYEYVIRSEKNGEFLKITDNGLEFVPKITDIADEIAQRLKLSPDNVNEMLKFLTQQNRLKWLDEAGYYKLLQ